MWAGTESTDGAVVFSGTTMFCKPCVPEATSSANHLPGEVGGGGCRASSSAPLPALPRRGPPAPAHSPPRTAGVCCSRGGGFHGACALGRRCRLSPLPPLGWGGGFPAHAHCPDSIAEPALRLRWFGTFQKTRGRGDGEGGLGFGLVVFSLLQLISPPSVRFRTCHRLHRNVTPLLAPGILLLGSV